MRGVEVLVRLLQLRPPAASSSSPQQPLAGLSVRALKALFAITAAEQADGQHRSISVRWVRQRNRTWGICLQLCFLVGADTALQLLPHPMHSSSPTTPTVPSPRPTNAPHNSMLEVYNEALRDLLASGADAAKLDVSTAQHSAAENSTAQHSTAQKSSTCTRACTRLIALPIGWPPTRIHPQPQPGHPPIHPPGVGHGRRAAGGRAGAGARPDLAPSDRSGRRARRAG